jgi:membrane protein DedA with SNARE-associated domain
MNLLHPLFEKWLGALIRHGLTALGTYLIGQGFVGESQWTEFVTGAVAVAVPICWSLLQKWRQQITKEVAKRMPEGTSDETIKHVIEEMHPAERRELALKVE